MKGKRNELNEVFHKIQALGSTIQFLGAEIINLANTNAAMADKDMVDAQIQPEGQADVGSENNSESANSLSETAKKLAGQTASPSMTVEGRKKKKPVMVNCRICA